MENFICDICKKEIEGQYPNNAEPVVENGKCCNECNDGEVLEARLKAMGF